MRREPAPPLFSSSWRSSVRYILFQNWPAGTLLAESVLVLTSGWADSANFNGVSHQFFVTLGHVHNDASVAPQIGELSFPIVSGQIRMIVQFHVDVAPSRLD